MQERKARQRFQEIHCMDAITQVRELLRLCLALTNSQALIAFYTKPDPERSNAHHWLLAYQKSANAWAGSVELLRARVG